MDLDESNLLHKNETHHTTVNVNNDITKQDNQTQTSTLETPSKGAWIITITYLSLT